MKEHQWKWKGSTPKAQNVWRCSQCQASIDVHGLRPEPYLRGFHILEDCDEEAVRQLMES